MPPFAHTDWYDIADKRFAALKQDALTHDFNPPLPDHAANLSTYLSALGHYKQAVEDYCAGETPEDELQIRRTEDRTDNLIAIRTLLDAFGADNPDLKMLFIKQYAAALLERRETSLDPLTQAGITLSDSARSTLYRNKHLLSVEVEETYQERKQLNLYLASHPDITLRYPLLTEQHNVYQQAGGLAITIDARVAQTAAMYDVADDLVDVHGLRL